MRGPLPSPRRLTPHAAAAPPAWLRVTLATSRFKGAGTSAAVSLELLGDAGATPATRLPAQPADFSPGTQAVFRLCLAPVGALRRLVVSHDAAGPAPHWHLDWAEVLEEASGERQGMEGGTGPAIMSSFRVGLTLTMTGELCNEGL